MIEVELSSDQRMLLAATTQFLERTSSSQLVRERSERGAGLDRDWWTIGAELGWMSFLVPEELGGGSVSGAGLVDLALVAEEAGRRTAPGPLIPASAAISALAGAAVANDSARALLEDALAGRSVITWAVHEPDAAWDPTRPRAVARRAGDKIVLTGTKDRVEFGADSDHFVVEAMLDGELAQLVVPRTASGVRIEPVWSLDLARSFATVTFDDVELGGDALLGHAEVAIRAVERQAQLVHVLQSAETAGSTEYVFDLTRQWATDRFAFGRPLASYQAIKHRMADMVTVVHALQAIVRSAAEAVHLESPAAPKLARTAAIFAGTRSLDLMQDCVQIHGGIGVTWEHDLHLYLRRATVNRAHYGTPEELTAALEHLLGS